MAIVKKEPQRGGAATKRISLASGQAQSQKSPLPPFSKGGLGGISEVSFQIGFLHKISID